MPCSLHFGARGRALVLVLGIMIGPGCVFDPSGLSPLHGEGCGNGVVESGEACDDGNTTACDGCAGDCGRVDGVCGDGVTECGEVCDDGNLLSGDGCSPVCQIGSACGDALVDVVDGEACDDGNLENGDGCDAICQIESWWSCQGVTSLCEPTCGDGVLLTGEQCDDGNPVSGDGCDATCLPEVGWSCEGAPSVCEPVCGDGVILGGELCDDSNNAPDDGCNNICQVELGWDCSPNPGACESICGDGVIVGSEACDDGNLNNDDGCEGTCTPTPGCWSHSFGGHSYYFCALPRIWTDASAMCNALGYQLVTIDDEPEDTWVADTAAAYGVGAWWIGMNDRVEEGSWSWVDGSPVSYTHWGPDEPNNVGGIEHCGVLLESTVPAYSWNDADCNHLKACVCELP